MEKNYRRFTLEEILECRTNTEKMNELIKNCQAMINKISRKVYLDKSYDHEDKMQIASMGIIRAVHKFNADLGVDFYTYCHNNVRKELLREVQRTQTISRGGRGRDFDYSTLNEDESVKAIRNVSIDKIEEVSHKVGDILNDTGKLANTHEIYIEKNEEWDFLTKELNLPPHKLAIFTQYYLDNKPQYEIASERNVSKQRINAIINEIEKKIRERYTYEELFEKLH